MSYTAITTAEIADGQPVVGAAGFGQKCKDDLDWLYGVVGTLSSVGIPNGSFEIATIAGTPDGWTVSTDPGGTFALSTTAPDHGLTHAKFTRASGAGNIGGTLTSDYIECSQLITYTLNFIHWASAAGMKNKVQIAYYTKAKEAVSTLDLYNSTANPTSPTVFSLSFTPAATARYFKVILVGGFTDTDVAGSIYFDNIILEPERQCKIWALINGTGTPAVTKGFNVSSITDLGVGYYEVNFICSLLDANYAVLIDTPHASAADVFGVTASSFGTASSKGVSTVRIDFSDGAGAADVAQASIVCFR